MKRILSIDGGGMHGIKPAVWCQIIEGAAQAPCADVFDLIAGTSTGAVLAGALGLKIATSEISTLYLERGKDIFRDPRGLPETLRKPQYRGTHIKNVLGEYYHVGNRPARLRDVHTHIMITAFLFEQRGHGGWRPAFFKSWEPHEKEMLILDAVQASSQAPTTHPMHTIERADGEKDYYTDGGVFATNPSLCALVDALQLWPGAGITEDLVLISMGTGIRPRHERAKTHGGLVWWAERIVPVFLEGMISVAHYQAERLMKALPRLTYIRLDVETPGKKADEIRPRVLNREAVKATRAAQDHAEFQAFLQSL